MAALPSISATALPPAISQFLRENPRISLVLRDALAEEMRDMLRNDEVDFAISSPIVGDNSFEFTLLTDRSHGGGLSRGSIRCIVSPRLKLEQLIAIRSFSWTAAAAFDT
jgi:DNA-binding transcriptional LysR family regulator